MILRKELPAAHRTNSNRMQCYRSLQRAGNGERKLSKESRTSCETCTYYIYDEEYECYLCDKNMDEDDYIRLMTNQHYQCPYYRNGDDYLVVRKQLQNHRKSKEVQNQKNRLRRKAGESLDQILPFFKKDLCASTGGFRPFDPGIIKQFSILLRAGYCLQVS